ncbi:autotransporter outer membrane beta-barrel domain-containing protein, partial [Salmonella enterica]|nr:autotransporter outer membrane beta-barrel domain-containing protein [Salmonella enterica]EHU0426187.1 autotransporter outer membrane beta-barrel domain-containing protein [Salmonella enterica]EJL4801798.1 autotransporter outer membrane beta-barrel domain-containing protein [Salmonella enterica]ELR6874274.1 autotransporter outer membrane beta-barrel domain-containing protein [Salmonella enterica]
VQNVSSGAVANSTTLNSGGTQLVSAGGSASGTIINAGAQTVNNGGHALNTAVSSGGFQRVSAGGVATGTTITNGGNQNIYVSGNVINTEINSGGKQTVYSGGAAISSVIMDGGLLNVSGGGVSAASVFTNGRLYAFSGNVNGTILNQGGRQFIYSGAAAINTVAGNEGREYILSGGQASKTVLNSGALQSVSSGGRATGTTINAGGVQIVYGGGVATGSLVQNGGLLRVDDQGQALDISLSNGGGIITSTGATVTGTNALGAFSIGGNTATNMLLENGGLLAVLPGNTAKNTVVNADGRLRIDDGGILSGKTVINNGGKIAANNIQNDGQFILNFDNDAVFSANLKGQGGLYKNNSGTITMTGDVSLVDGVNLNEGGLVIDSAKFNTNLKIAKNSIVSLLDSRQVAGAVVNSGHLILNNKSLINGNVDNDGDIYLGNTQLLSSKIIGDVKNSGNIILNPTSRSAGNTLIVSNYIGALGSTLTMGGGLKGDETLTDKLIVEGDASGVSEIAYINEGGAGAKTLEGINIISINGKSDATFSLKNRVVAGKYDYSLRKGNESGTEVNGWYLTSHLKNDKTVKKIRPESGSYTNNMELANTLFSINSQDRITEGQNSSMWMRIVGGHGKQKMADGQNDTNTTRFVQQIGGDIYSLESNKLGDFYIGLMGGYANAKGKTQNKLSGNHARNSINGYSVGGYGSWYQNGKNSRGAYIDGWLQYNWFKASVKGGDLSYEAYNIKGLTGSIEGGYNFKMKEWSRTGSHTTSFWLQPHMQTIWMGVNPDSHIEENGTKVEGTGENNFQTRLGVRAYWDIKENKNDKIIGGVKPYIEANWIYNTNEFGTDLNSDSSSASGMRNLGEAKIGITGNINNGLSINAGISHKIGGGDSHDTQGNLSMKVNF